MKKRRWNARRPMPANELFADDFLSADKTFGKSRRQKSGRKDQQLCRQVQRTLGLALAACADPMLHELLIDSVTPAPDASRLMVSVFQPRAFAEEAGARDDTIAGGNVLPAAVDLLRRLENVKTLLRHEVATAITRKRAPELIFRLVEPREVAP